MPITVVAVLLVFLVGRCRTFENRSPAPEALFMLLPSFLHMSQKQLSPHSSSIQFYDTLTFNYMHTDTHTQPCTGLNEHTVSFSQDCNGH